jgi:hypothetical protein
MSTLLPNNHLVSISFSAPQNSCLLPHVDSLYASNVLIEKVRAVV